MKKINWKDNALQMIKLIGGKENIVEIFHCATRLRFILKDDSKLQLDEIKKMPFFKGYNKQDQQHQIIIGAGVVDKIYRQIELMLSSNIENSNLSPENKQKLWNKQLSFKSNSFMLTKRGMNSFAAIFVPLVPVFIAGGMCLALKSLLSQIIGANASTNGFVYLLDIIGGAIMGSIPVFIGYTAAKKWGGNPFLGMAMGLILIAPALLNSYAVNTPVLLGYDISKMNENHLEDILKAYQDYLESIGQWHQGDPLSEAEAIKFVGIYYTIFSGFFRIKLIGYQAQVVPVLLVVALSVNLEKFLKKYTPEVIAIIVVPLGTIILSAWVAFWIIGPLGQIIGQGISVGLAGMFKYTNWMFIGFGGFILAGFYPLLVVTGLHQGFLPIETQLLTNSSLQFGHSFSFITPIACVSNIAQGTAALMLVFYSKSREDKSKAISSAFGGYTGITEPAMFGINLQLKPLFLAAMIGSAIGGWWLGMTHTVANSLGSASWIGLVQFDWTTDFTKTYFEQQNIHAILKQVPMGFHAMISMSLAAISTAIAAILLFKSNWGKLSLENYFNQNKM